MKFSPNETNINGVYKISYSALYAENNSQYLFEKPRYVYPSSPPSTFNYMRIWTFSLYLGQFWNYMDVLGLKITGK